MRDLRRLTLAFLAVISKRVSLPFPHPEGLAADEDFHGHLTDASRSHRPGTRGIAPGSPGHSVLPRHRDQAIVHAPECRWTPQQPDRCNCTGDGV